MAFAVALPAVAMAVAVGLLLGVVAGWFGGLVDSVLIVLTDALLAFPAVVLALAVIALYGGSIRNTILLVGLAFVPGYFRVARALVLAARNDVYVDAERALGATTARILAAHVVPNVLPPLFILVAMDIPGRDRGGVGPVVPRPGRAAAHGGLGDDAQRGLRGRVRLALAADRAVRRAGARDARLHLPRARRCATWPIRASPDRRPACAGRRRPVSAAPLLDVDGLDVVYHAPPHVLHALRDVQLSVAPGEIVGVIGESGCGKSTLGSAVIGLLPGNAEVRAGRVVLAGDDLLRLDAEALRRRRAAAGGR